MVIYLVIQTGYSGVVHRYFLHPHLWQSNLSQCPVDFMSPCTHQIHLIPPIFTSSFGTRISLDFVGCLLLRTQLYHFYMYQFSFAIVKSCDNQKISMVFNKTEGICYLYIWEVGLNLMTPLVLAEIHPHVCCLEM